VGPDGKPLQVDHKCDVTLCERPDHLRVLTGPDNTKRRGATRGPNKRASGEPRTEPAFAIALFEGIEQPAVQPRTVSLDELAQLLGKVRSPGRQAPRALLVLDSLRRRRN